MHVHRTPSTGHQSDDEGVTHVLVFVGLQCLRDISSVPLLVLSISDGTNGGKNNQREEQSNHGFHGTISEVLETVITLFAKSCSKSSHALPHQQHSPRLHNIASPQPIEIHSTRQSITTEDYAMISGLLLFVHKLRYLLAEGVVDCEHDE